MYKQVLDPVSHSLGLTSIFAILPLLTLFVLLGIVRLKAQWASLCALGVALLVAIIVYSMPVGQAADSGLEGAAFGFWPIMWIVLNALWIYNMTEATGYFAVLRRAFAMISDDVRVQVVVIAFCFGALLEALAGFGTPAGHLQRHARRARAEPAAAPSPSRWSPTPLRWRSAPSPSPSPRSGRSRACRSSI